MTNGRGHAGRRWLHLALSALAVAALGCRGGDGGKLPGGEVISSPPVLVLAPESLDFVTLRGGPAPAPQTLQLTNGGDGTLGWLATGDAGWLRVTPARGTAPSTVTVSVDAAGLSTGGHGGTITLMVQGGTRPPRTVPVSLVVLDLPTFATSPTELRFSMLSGAASPAPLALELVNAGGGTLAWTASTTGGDWLSVEPPAGTAPATVNVRVNGSGVAAGEHTGSVVLTSEGAANSPHVVPVVLTVTADVDLDGLAVAEVGRGEHDAAVADFDGDGVPDLAVTNADSGTVSVLLGTSRGGLQARLDTGVGVSPDAVAAGDLDGDGKPDLAVANQLSDSVTLLLGRGDGTFGAPRTLAVGPGPRGILLVDLDADGALDLVTANTGDYVGAGTVSVLLGTGAGAFGAATEYPAGDAPSDVAAGDLDADGHLDLAVADYDFSNTSDALLAILRGDGAGAFAAPTFLAAGWRLTSVAVADLDGVGPPDLVVGSESDHLRVLLAAGGGAFAGATPYPDAGGGARSVVVVDLDGDGARDLVVTHNCTCDSTASLRRGNGDGTFGAVRTLPVGGYALVAADFDGDGRADLAGADWGQYAFVARGLGGGTIAASANLAAGTHAPQGVAAGDLDGDGRVDLVAVDRSTSYDPTAKELWTWLGDGAGGFGSPVRYPVSSPWSVTLGDLDGDGLLDVITAGDGAVSALLGSGAGALGPATSFVAPGQARAVAAGDLDGDGDLDLVTASTFPNQANVLLGDGSGAFGAARAYAVGTEPRSIAMGRLDADADLDLVVGSRSSGSISVLLGEGGGAFGPASPLHAPILRFAGLADFDEDGLLDLVYADWTGTELRKGLGDGTFDAPWFAATPGATGVIGDFNHDGHLDLALAELGTTAVSFLIGTGDGTFVASARRYAAALPVAYSEGTEDASLAAGDFDGDGRLDLACASSGFLGPHYVAVMLDRGP